VIRTLTDLARDLGLEVTDREAVVPVNEIKPPYRSRPRRQGPSIEAQIRSCYNEDVRRRGPRF
jgi:hypothetical protein